MLKVLLPWYKVYPDSSLVFRNSLSGSPSRMAACGRDWFNAISARGNYRNVEHSLGNTSLRTIRHMADVYLRGQGFYLL